MLKKLFYFFTILVLLLPLVVSKYTMNPFIFYKTVFLQIFSLALLITYIYYVFYIEKKVNKIKLKHKFTPLFISIVLFYISIFISSLFGYDWNRSLWSRSERMIGLFVFFHYFILYIVWRNFFSFQELKNIWKYFAGFVGGIVILIGLIQIFNPLFLSNLGSARVGSTLGNAIYLAGFCTFVFFSALYFFLTSNSKYKVLWLVEIFFSIIILFATQTRGDIIGFFIGLVFFLLLYLFLLFNSLSQKIKKIFFLFVISIIILPLLLFFFKDSRMVNAIPVFNRFFSQPLSQSTGGTRIVMWKTAIISWQQKPLFGWGWDNFYYAANKNYLPEFLRFGHGEEWTDNAHNVVLNTLATVGLIGLATYLLVFFSLIYMSIKLLKYYKKDNKYVILILILLGFLLSHFIRNFFAFEDLTSYLYLFFIFVIFDVFYINYKIEINNNVFSNFIKKEKNNLFFNKIIVLIKGLLFVLICLVTFLSLYRFVYIPAKASYWQSQSIYTALLDFDKSLDVHRNVISIDYNIYRADAAYNYADFLLSWMHGHPDFAIGKYRDLAEKMHYTSISALYSYLSDYPDDPRVYYILGNAFMDAYDFWMNMGYVEKAEEFYNKGLLYSPNRQSLAYGLIRAKIALGKNEEALVLAEKTLKNDETIGESYWILSFVYKNMNKNEEAVEKIKEAYNLKYNFSDNELTLAFRVLLSYGDPSFMSDYVKERLLSKKIPNKYLLQAYVDYLRYIGNEDDLQIFESMF